MQIEHIALNVAEPVAMAKWYVQHCGFQVRRSMDVAPFTCFICDSTGQVLVELYDRKDKTQWTRDTFDEPLLFHLALISEDLIADTDRLCAAGAIMIERTIESDGFGLVMLRDPFGMPLQLCRRRQSMVVAI